MRRLVSIQRLVEQATEDDEDLSLLLVDEDDIFTLDPDDTKSEDNPVEE